MRLLDLFCGRFGWSKAFAARGWECVGVDWSNVESIPEHCTFIQTDVWGLRVAATGLWWYGNCSTIGPFDFVCASPPCQEFSKFGMPNFYPSPEYPFIGTRLFNHTREQCELSKIPYVIENVWGAQKFVGNAVNHCGPFYLWGNAVPPLMNQGIKKGGTLGTGGWQHTGTMNKKANAAAVAEIPPELANCVADYAERLLELTNSKQGLSGQSGPGAPISGER